MAKVYRPLTLMDALYIQNEEHAQVMAGGTDLMTKPDSFSIDSRPVLCIGQLNELHQISKCGDALILGAACTISELLSSPLLPDCIKLPLSNMASPAIRNIGTIGGNLCNASPAADTLPMLYALDATICLQSEDSFDDMSVSDFIVAPRKTQIRDNQILTTIRIPLQQNWCPLYRKIGARKANSITKLSFYAVSAHHKGCLRDIRIAFGAIAPTVVRCREAETAFLNSYHSQSSELPCQIADLYSKLFQPIDDVRSTQLYRRTVAIQMLTQYLTEEMNI